MPACDGRTDGRTDIDGRPDVKPIAITCFSIADARKKLLIKAKHFNANFANGNRSVKTNVPGGGVTAATQKSRATNCIKYLTLWH